MSKKQGRKWKTEPVKIHLMDDLVSLNVSDEELKRIMDNAYTVDQWNQVQKEMIKLHLQGDYTFELLGNIYRVSEHIVKGSVETHIFNEYATTMAQLLIDGMTYEKIAGFFSVPTEFVENAVAYIASLPDEDEDNE